MLEVGYSLSITMAMGQKKTLYFHHRVMFFDVTYVDVMRVG